MPGFPATTDSPIPPLHLGSGPSDPRRLLGEVVVRPEVVVEEPALVACWRLARRLPLLHRLMMRDLLALLVELCPYFQLLVVRGFGHFSRHHCARS
jgi:hypothetical protein